MRGVHEPYNEPVVPPREEGEDITHWMERIAKANRWKLPESETREPGSEG